MAVTLVGKALQSCEDLVEPICVEFVGKCACARLGCWLIHDSLLLAPLRLDRAVIVGGSKESAAAAAEVDVKSADCTLH